MEKTMEQIEHFRVGHTVSAEYHPAIPAEHHKISAGTGNRSGGDYSERASSMLTVGIVKFPSETG